MVADYRSLALDAYYAAANRTNAVRKTDGLLVWIWDYLSTAPHADGAHRWTAVCVVPGVDDTVDVELVDTADLSYVTG